MIPDWNKTLLEKSAERSKSDTINNDDNKDEWIFENSRETWTRIFIHRDAFFNNECLILDHKAYRAD